MKSRIVHCWIFTEPGTLCVYKSIRLFKVILLLCWPGVSVLFCFVSFCFISRLLKCPGFQREGGWVLVPKIILLFNTLGFQNSEHINTSLPRGKFQYIYLLEYLIAFLYFLKKSLMFIFEKERQCGQGWRQRERETQNPKP